MNGESPKMDDIDRAQIGQKREVACEQINHPKIPKTNLPPMRAKGVDDKYNWLLSPYRKVQKNKSGRGFALGWFLVIILGLAVIITKLIGVW